MGHGTVTILIQDGDFGNEISGGILYLTTCLFLCHYSFIESGKTNRSIQPTDHRQEGGDGGLCRERGVPQHRLGARLDGGDGEAGRTVLGVDRLQRLVQTPDLGEDVLRRRRRLQRVGGGGTVGGAVSV